MKIRNGFVSNSSSSSFVVNKTNLSLKQIDMIVNYDKYAKQYIAKCKNYPYKDTKKLKEIEELFKWYDKGWDVTEDKVEIRGETIIENFDFSEYLDKIVKVDRKYITYERDG